MRLLKQTAWLVFGLATAQQQLIDKASVAGLQSWTDWLSPQIDCTDDKAKLLSILHNLDGSSILADLCEPTDCQKFQNETNSWTYGGKSKLRNLPKKAQQIVSFFPTPQHQSKIKEDHTEANEDPDQVDNITKTVKSPQQNAPSDFTRNLQEQAIASLLPCGPIVLDCHMSTSIALLDRIKEKYRVKNVVVHGLSRAMVFDDDKATLHVMADTRPTRATLRIELTVWVDGSQQNHQVVLDISSVCANKRIGRSLAIDAGGCTGCSTNDMDQKVNGPVASGPFTFSIGVTPATYYSTGYQIVRVKSSWTCFIWQCYCHEVGSLIPTFSSITKNGVAISQPSWLTYATDSSFKLNVNYGPTDCHDVGTYVITIGQVVVTSPSCQNTTPLSTTINVPSCTLTINASFALQPLCTHYVSVNTSVSLPTYSSAVTCGTISAAETTTSSPSLPSCVTLTATLMTASGCSKLDVGTYAITKVVTLSTSETGLCAQSPPITTTWSLKILCKTQSMTLNNPKQVTLTYEIEQPAATFSVPTYTLYPDCNAAAPSLLIIGTQASLFTISGAIVSVSTTNFALVGVHTLTIKATDSTDSTIIDQTFQINLTITCRITSLTAIPLSIPATSHVIGPSNTQISMPVISVASSGCQAPSHHFLDNTNGLPVAWINVSDQISTSNVALAGTYQTKLVIEVIPSSPERILDALYAPIEIVFDVTLCRLDSLTPTTLTPPFLLTYLIDGQNTYVQAALPDFVIATTPATCGGFTKTVTLVRNDAITTIPSFVLDLVNSQTIGVQTTDQLHSGVYNFKLSAQVASINGQTLVNQDFTFLITMCGLVTIATNQASTVTYSLSNPAPFTVPLVYTMLPVQPVICLPTYTVSMSETFNGVTQVPAWGSLALDNQSFNGLTTSDTSLQGSHAITIAIASLDPVLATLPMTFYVNFICTVTPTNPTISNIEFPISGSFYMPQTIAVPASAFTFAPPECVTSYTWTQVASPLAAFITNDAASILVDTTDPAKAGLYSVVVTAAPQPAAFIQLNSPATSSFSVNAYVPCTITAITPQSAISSPVDRYLNNPTPTTLAVPTFVITPATCDTIKTIKLVETTSGSDVVVATFDEDTSTSTSTDPKIVFKSGYSQIILSQVSNSQAATRTFKITAEVTSTPLIQGMLTQSPLVFTVNLICTITSLTLTNPTTDYCHQALLVPYATTPLVPPSWSTVPSDCPGVSPVFILVQPNNGDAPFDPLLIQQTGADFAVIAQNAAQIGSYNYSWVATITTTPNLIGTTQRTDIQINVTGCISSAMVPATPGADSFIYEINPALLSTQAYLLKPFIFSSNSCANPYLINIVRTDVDPTIPFTYDLAQLSYATTDTSLTGIQNYQVTATQSHACPGQTPLTNSSYNFSLTLQCRVTAFTPSFVPVDIVDYKFMQIVKTYPLASMVPIPGDCGATFMIELFYVQAGVAGPLPSFMTFNSAVPQFSADLADPVAIEAFYPLRMIVSSLTTPFVIGGFVAQYDFNYILWERCMINDLLSPVPVPFQYTITAAAIVDPTPLFFIGPVGCVFVQAYEATLVSKVPTKVIGEVEPFNAQMSQLPDFFVWDPAVGSTIQGSNYLEAWNTYTILIRGYDLNGGVSNSDYFLEITTVVDCVTNALLTPSTAIPKTLAYQVGDSTLVITFPLMVDQIALQLTVPDVCGPIEYRLVASTHDGQVKSPPTLPAFAKFNAAKKQLEIYTIDNNNAGTFYFLLDVFYQVFEGTEPNNPHFKQVIKVAITANDKPPAYTVGEQLPVEVPQVTTPKATKEEENYAREETEEVEEVNAYGINIALFKKLPPPPAAKMNKRVELRFAECELKPINESGKLTIQIQERVNLMNEGLRIDADMMSLTFILNSEEAVSFEGWDLVSYEETQIQIQLKFSSPLLISTGVKPDQIVVHLNKDLFLPVYEPYHMVDIESPKPNLHFFLEDDLPMQMASQKEFATLESVQSSVQKSSMVAMMIPFVAQIGMKGAMKKLWFYFNTIQLASTFTYFNLVRAPANVTMVKSAYEKIINLELIPDQLMAQIKASIGLGSQQKLSEDQVEPAPSSSRRHLFVKTYSKEEIRKNRIFLGLGIGAFVAVIAAITYYRKRLWGSLPKLITDNVQYVYSLIVFNGIIRTLIQLFFPTVLAALMAIATAKETKRSIILPAIQLAIFFGFLLCTLIHIEYAKEEKMDTPEYKAKFGAFVTNVETYRKPQAAHYSTFFMIRRALIAFTIAYLGFNGPLQSLIAVNSSLLMLSWYINVFPLDSKAKNYLEISNEFLVCILGYFGFLFTNYVEDPAARYQFGYLYIGFLAAALLLNLINLGYTTILEIKQFWWYYKKEMRRYCSKLRRSPKKPEVKSEPKKPEPVKEKPFVEKSVFLRLMEGESISQVRESSSVSSSFDSSSASQSVEQSERSEEISERSNPHERKINLNDLPGRKPDNWEQWESAQDYNDGVYGYPKPTFQSNKLGPNQIKVISLVDEKFEQIMNHYDILERELDKFAAEKQKNDDRNNSGLIYATRVSEAELAKLRTKEQNDSSSEGASEYVTQLEILKTTQFGSSKQNHKRLTDKVDFRLFAVKPCEDKEESKQGMTFDEAHSSIYTNAPLNFQGFQSEHPRTGHFAVNKKSGVDDMFEQIMKKYDEIEERFDQPNLDQKILRPLKQKRPMPRDFSPKEEFRKSQVIGRRLSQLFTPQKDEENNVRW